MAGPHSAPRWRAECEAPSELDGEGSQRHLRSWTSAPLPLEAYVGAASYCHPSCVSVLWALHERLAAPGARHLPGSYSLPFPLSSTPPCASGNRESAPSLQLLDQPQIGRAHV